MRRRTLALLLATPLALAAVAGVVVLAPSGDGAPEAPGPDRVTLYPNGLAFVRSEVAFASEGGDARLLLRLPATARVGTLEVAGDGVAVRQVVSDALDATGLRPGDDVVVHAEDGLVLEGVFLGEEQGRLVLATGNGTALVERGRVVAVALREPGEAAPGTDLVEVLLRAPPGEHRLRVTYLMDGAGWTPTYRFDAGTGRLAFFATVAAPADWGDVALEIVAGEPHLVHAHAPPRLEAARAEDVAAGDVFRPAEALGSLHVFALEDRVDLARGETVRLLVAEGEMDVLRRFHAVDAFVGPVLFAGSDGGGREVPVRERVTVQNALGEPLPAGVVDVYRDGTWVGQDLLPALPPGDVANLTLAAATDVHARLVPEGRNGTAEAVTWALAVENLKAEAVDVRASLAFPLEGARVVDAEPPPAALRADEAVWDATVPAGSTATFRLTLVHEDARAVPVEPSRPVAERAPPSP